MLKSFAIGVSVLMLAACATTELTSHKDPFYHGGARHRFLFEFDRDVAREVRLVEKFAEEHFADEGLIAIPFTRAVPPVRTYTEEERDELLGRTNAELLIRLRRLPDVMEDVHVPREIKTTEADTTKGEKDSVRRGKETTTVVSGGYSKTVLREMNLQCSVVELATRKTIWTSEAHFDFWVNARGLTVEDCYRRTIKAVVKELRRDGIAVE